MDLNGWEPPEPGAGFGGTPTATPDPAEGSQLEVHARYRILLLHAARGYFDAAQTVYDTLQPQFPSWRPGHPHAQLATAFWEEFSVSQDLAPGRG